MKKIKKIAIAAALLASTGAAMAQTTDYNPSWYVSPSISAFNPDNGFGVNRTDIGGGLKFGKPISESFDLQVGGTYGRAKKDGQSYRQETLGVDALYLLSRKSIRPFLLLGAGAERSTADLTLNGHHSKSSPFLSGGLGFQADFTDRLSFQADIRQVLGANRGNAFPNIDRSHNIYTTVAFNYALGAKPVPPAPAPAPAPAPVVETPPPAPVAPPPPPPAPKFEKITMSAQELFAFNSAKLAPTQPKLDDLATLLNNNPSVGNVTITGYTDRIGSDKYNQKLSEQRAGAVKDYLVGKGVAANRLNAVGKGKANPVVACEGKKMKQADLIKCLEPNRRVEVDQVTVERRVN